MFGGPWDSTLNMMGVPSLKLGVPSFYISFEFWKVVHPSVKAQCCPQVSNFEGPFQFFGGHLKFLRATYAFFTKAELVPIICRDQASPFNLGTSPSSTNREKLEKIGRSDGLLHPEDRKKQSLIRLFSN